LVERQGIPLGGTVAPSTPAEVKLVDAALATVRVPPLVTPGRPRRTPPRLIADRGYDSDELRQRLGARGIQLIAPHRSNRRRPRTADGRALRRYRRRWIVERSTAWFDGFRRLVVRWERHLAIYRAFFHLACAMIVLRWL
jgi:transposase